MIRHVRQEHPNGCQIAVLAMVLRISYAEALRRVQPEGGEPTGSTWLPGWLAEAGWATATLYRVTQPGNKPRPKWPLDPWADLHYVNVQYSSPSGMSHAVLLLADGRVLDPMHDEPRRLSDYCAVNSMSALVPVNPPPTQCGSGVCVKCGQSNDLTETYCTVAGCPNRPPSQERGSSSTD